jgi:hypothetical protein
LLVLAIEPDHVAGVDLASGAMVRAWTPEPIQEDLKPYDVVAGTLDADRDRLPDPAQPEAVVLAEGPERVGRMTGRRAERYLRPLVHPAGQPLLGTHGPAVPFWERRADHPSIALVEPEGSAVVHVRGSGLACWFRWRGRPVELPFVDPWVTATMEHTGRRVLGARRDDRLVVALTPPIDGRCHKVVATLLRRP